MLEVLFLVTKMFHLKLDAAELCAKKLKEMKHMSKLNKIFTKESTQCPIKTYMKQYIKLPGFQDFFIPPKVSFYSFTFTQ